MVNSRIQTLRRVKMIKDEEVDGVQDYTTDQI